MTDGKRLGADNVTKTERYGKTIDGRRENRIGSENRLCSNMYSTLSLAARNDITKKRDSSPNFETNMNTTALPLSPSRLLTI
jgi:hypothetical protein